MSKQTQPANPSALIGKPEDDAGFLAAAHKLKATRLRLEEKRASLEDFTKQVRAVGSPQGPSNAVLSEVFDGSDPATVGELEMTRRRLADEVKVLEDAVRYGERQTEKERSRVSRLLAERLAAHRRDLAARAAKAVEMLHDLAREDEALRKEAAAAGYAVGALPPVVVLPPQNPDPGTQVRHIDPGEGEFVAEFHEHLMRLGLATLKRHAG